MCLLMKWTEPVLCTSGKRYFWNQLTESNEKLHWLRFNAEKGFENVDDSEDEGKNLNM